MEKWCLKPCLVILKDYQGMAIPTVGYDTFQVSYQSFSDKLPLIVVKNDLPCLLGLDWFAAMHLNITGVHSIIPDVSDMIFPEFADVFDDHLGKYTGCPISFNLDPQVQPIHLKPQRVPLALRPRVDRELDKLISQGILVLVDHSKWETPIVIPLKPDGSVHVILRGPLTKRFRKIPTRYQWYNTCYIHWDTGKYLQS